MTQSPFLKGLALPLAETTSKTPSFPGVTDGSAVPIRDVNGGLEPYVPWIVFISAGLIGAARDLTRTEDSGIEGDMECVCSLSTRISIQEAHSWFNWNLPT